MHFGSLVQLVVGLVNLLWTPCVVQAGELVMNTLVLTLTLTLTLMLALTLTLTLTLMLMLMMVLMWEMIYCFQQRCRLPDV